MKRSAPMKRGGRVKARNPKRQARSFVRAFGSAARVTWMRARPCYVCGATPCRAHHHELHTVGRFTFEATHNVSLNLGCAATEQAWQRYLNTNGETNGNHDDE